MAWIQVGCEENVDIWKMFLGEGRSEEARPLAVAKTRAGKCCEDVKKLLYGNGFESILSVFGSHCRAYESI
jgi:hypothetical protein